MFAGGALVNDIYSERELSSSVNWGGGRNKRGEEVRGRTSRMLPRDLEALKVKDPSHSPRGSLFKYEPKRGEERSF